MISISPVVRNVDDPAYWPIQFRGGPWDGDHMFIDAKEYASMPKELLVGPTLGIPEQCHYMLATVRLDWNGSVSSCYIYIGKLKISPEIETWLRESQYGRTGRLESIPGRDDWGRLVRETWVRWARHQPNCKPSWLTPYDELTEAEKEVDRRIGIDVAHAAVAVHRRFPSAFKHEY